MATGFLGHPKNIRGEVFVLVLGIRPDEVATPCNELGVVLIEAVGDVFEEDESEDDVLVLRRVHVVAQLIGGEPELSLKTNIC